MNLRDLPRHAAAANDGYSQADRHRGNARNPWNFVLAGVLAVIFAAVLIVFSALLFGLLVADSEF